MMPAVNPLFSLTPLSPNTEQGLDAYGSLYTFGGAADAVGSNFQAQNDNDEIILGFDAVSTTETDLFSPNHPFRACTALFVFQIHNLKDSDQLLLMFPIRRLGNVNAQAQFFIFSEYIESVDLTPNGDVHALIVPRPDDYSEAYGMHLNVFVRLAGDLWPAMMGIKGMDCYII